MPNDAMRQVVVLLACPVCAVAMLVSWLRGGDLLHLAFTALWVLPVASMIIFYVFRMWFLVLQRSIREKQEQNHAEQPGHNGEANA